MNKKIILTIVIPSYNIEKYVCQAAQPYLDCEIQEKIEVLFVNDGSNDNTEKLIDQYTQNYPDLFRQIKKENGGHGSTINLGIKEAKGKYFKVVDGDDWLEQGALNRIVRKLETVNSDLVITNYIELNEETHISSKKDNINFVDNIEQSSECMYNHGQLCFHMLIYKTKILRANKIKLEEKCFYVDMEYILYPLPFIKTYIFINEYLYIYRIGNPLQSVSINGFIKNRKNHVLVLKKIMNFYDTQRNTCSSNEMLEYIENIIISLIKVHYLIYLNMKTKKETKQSLIAFDKYILNKDVKIYQKVINKKIWILRKNNYCFFYILNIFYKSKFGKFLRIRNLL